MRAHVEHYRRLRQRPCHGYHVFCFNDCWPSISWSLVDHARAPKAAYAALARASAPLLRVLTRFPLDAEQPDLAVTIVNDTAGALPAAVLSWTFEDGPR